ARHPAAVAPARLLRGDGLMARTVDYATPAVLRRARGASTARSLAARLLIYLVLLAGAVWFVLPLVWMAASSLKTKADIFQYPPVLFPWPFHLENYADLFAVWPFWTYLRNTLTITLPSVLGQLLSSSLAAYGFARMRWPGRNVVFVVVLATMMLP